MNVMVAELMNLALDTAPSTDEREPIGSARRLWEDSLRTTKPSGDRRYEPRGHHTRRGFGPLAG